MDTIFFSYSRVDSAFVLKLAKDLREAGVNIWLDQLDIAPGSHWDASIEKALQSSKTLLIILSPHSVASENVMDEVSYALEEGKRVIPILLSNCETPFRLRRLQRIDFTGDYRTGFNYLLDTIGSKEKKNEPVSKEPVKTEPAPEYKSPVSTPEIEVTKKNSKKYYFIGGGVLVLILMILLIIKPGSSTNEKTELTKDVDTGTVTDATIPQFNTGFLVDRDMYYYITNASNEFCMSVKDGSSDEDAYIVVVDRKNYEGKDYLKVRLNGDGAYSFEFKNSGKFMFTYDDNFMRQASAKGVSLAYFKLISTDDGYIQIEDPSGSGNVLGLDPASEGFTNGQHVISMKNNQSLQTKWKLNATNEKYVNHTDEVSK